MEEAENGFVAKLQCNPSHLVYQVHFPGTPITPGVCLIQLAGELLERRLNRRLWLKTVKNVKFLSAVIPAEGKVVSYAFSNLEENETECKVQAVVSDETVVYVKMSLVFSYGRV